MGSTRFRVLVRSTLGSGKFICGPCTEKFFGKGAVCLKLRGIVEFFTEDNRFQTLEFHDNCCFYARKIFSEFSRPANVSGLYLASTGANKITRDN